MKNAAAMSLSRLAPMSTCAAVIAAVLTACGGGSGGGTVIPPFTPTPDPAPVAVAKGTRATVALLETTDLHANVRSFDYFKLAEDKSYGYERTATLINAARKEFQNTMLFDNGDTIQGTALADYEALVSRVPCTQPLSVYKVMNATGYDAGTLGNHEFNYGLDFLNQVLGGGLDVDGVDGTKKCAGPTFPMVLANVQSVKSGKPLLAPYTIVTKQFTATTPDGKTVTVPVKVGVIGFTTPGILNWDKRFLEGKVRTEGAVEAATKYIPELRAKGADIVVALQHGGLDASPYSPTMESPGLYLSKVPGIDALMMGHQHGTFPDPGTKPSYTQAGVDNKAGTVNGVPAVMASSWGKALGLIRLDLVYDGKAWGVDKTKTFVEARSTQSKDSAGKVVYVDADSSVAPLVETQHQATITYVKTPIGTTDFRMSTYFADVGDPGAIQIVNQAQADYVKNYIAANLPQYASLPVLSVSAPFKSGYEGGRDYTDVAAGNVAINNAADLYLYPNTVYAVKVTGAEIKAWLEAAAKRFNKINPDLTTDQQLISTFPGYNFDMFTTPDVQYEIDVTQAEGSRIKNLTYLSAPIDPAKEFVIATNNYRATSGASFIPALDGRATIYPSPDANRDVLIDYIKAKKTITRTANGAARSWRFTQVTTKGNVVFTSGQGQLSAAQDAGLTNISLLTADDGSGKGRSVYKLELNPAP
ncbi:MULTISPECIES: bifunctional 2',3'-cyclic-nucleotide 2'-phosphodiesterase/3'-nucleotidase [Variovorax]|mgnify:CR=1 FL=1|jgi:2',3'-cyclic-nucleotide 2'-phosphodiesterase / 3'-nucleotidase|uniref:bifunctional 2',3'-cyclic-nucleotide 2'-phosphodiesterase/3'-nucleotidase n=2 Tax=Comamonadaceae TaxID=80864 RepID=UPI0008693E5A|nr:MULTISPECIES: bifunctional 2',3'-cyclic-nucleotide 2'-phosphodiesterase/3'-nucleotidase [Variovorax]ODU13749.1 MAG: bifunctional metallophosphatase/5'-nucleotidase [Variovorax sp. SCN 67-85]ODV20681.1 MAG: bifunctional metallophosphatase/5'-nucleotidase [Variovorax sp. SCN 67-20]OJZ13687.1 MAG: bifunctional metallophosphatase/5'-nucleotidase [Variovorax sp. 67-131]UKI06344.1 bifunctional 2',3'-cyclic-nucleotide 2'-phosphodiesterase/3'-nucleotidase [Variovorax paradoxus]